MIDGVVYNTAQLAKHLAYKAADAAAGKDSATEAAHRQLGDDIEAALDRFIPPPAKGSGG